MMTITININGRTHHQIEVRNITSERGLRDGGLHEYDVVVDGQTQPDSITHYPHEGATRLAGLALNEIPWTHHNPTKEPT